MSNDNVVKLIQPQLKVVSTGDFALALAALLGSRVHSLLRMRYISRLRVLR
jgi:hypothetical protein